MSISTLLGPKVLATSDASKRVEVFELDNRIDNVALIAQRIGVIVDAILLPALSKVYSSLPNVKGGDPSHTPDGIDGGKDIVFGLSLANCAVCDGDLSSLLAPALNLLPIRMPLTGSQAKIAQTVQSDL